MKCFSALCGGGADENDMASGVACVGLSFHLRYGMLDQSENAIQIDRDGFPPLGFGHLFNGRILRRPDPVIGDQNI